MAPDFEYDPERALWKPNRRFFLFGLAAGIIAPTLPNLPAAPCPAASALAYLADRAEMRMSTIYPQDVWNAMMTQFQYDMAKNGTPRIYLEAPQ